jgi:tRNA (guanine26-N2/guanine27-N2)-dimethyltransferase
MAGDRDLAVAFATALGAGARRGWEMTASTGVRGLRLLQESPAFAEFLLSEANPRSFEVLRSNVAGERRARALRDAGERPPPGAPFDYVDVDPYGSPLSFLATAFGALADDGVLGVTATDLTVLAGAQAAACRRRYGANPVRGRLGPEGALRILLVVLALEARRSGRHIEPLLAYVGGHHVRAYVRVLPGAGAPDPVALVEPDRWAGPELSGRPPFGPFWLGPLIEPALAERLRVPASAAAPRELAGRIERFRGEAGPVAPFYYEANALASRLHLPRPPPAESLLELLRAGGYRATRTHVRPEGLRTDAPRSFVEEAARQALGAP